MDMARESGRRIAPTPVGYDRLRAHLAGRMYLDRIERATSAIVGGTMLTLRPTRRTPTVKMVAWTGGALLALALRRRPVGVATMGMAIAAGLLWRRRNRNQRESGPREAHASITVGRPASELARYWRESESLAVIVQPLAEVVARDGDQIHWRLQAFGRSFEWDTKIIEERPDESLRWRSLPGAMLPHEATVELEPAPGNRGTEVTLRVRIEPAAGVLSDAALTLLGTVPHLLLSTALHRFKSLAESGEVPTVARQPAARDSE